jgi:hypothetical protein
MPDGAPGGAGTLPKVALLVLSMVPLVPTLWAHAVGDLPVYFEAARTWLGGRTPYAELRFEYPPYALLAFAPAALVSSTLREFQVALGLELLLTDIAIRAALLWAARERRGAWAYAPSSPTRRWPSFRPSGSTSVSTSCPPGSRWQRCSRSRAVRPVAPARRWSPASG